MLLTMFGSLLRSLYLQVLTMADFISLPAPTLTTPASAIFFPATDDTKAYEKKKMMSWSPFSMYASRDILRVMITSGDLCHNLRIKKIQYYQRKVTPLHEFVVAFYEDITNPEVHNYMVIERWGSSFAPNTPHPKPVVHEILAADPETPVVGEPTAETDTAASVKRVALWSLEQFLDTFGSLKSIANDRILISYRREESDISLVEPGERQLLATMDAPPDSHVTVAHLLSMSSCISDDMPIYSLLESQCFYFGRANWTVVGRAMGCMDQVKFNPGADFMRGTPCSGRLSR
ncbi:hypothetical protein B0H10DRAFT_2443120 [Mycena sp. CBHHK59/15]|nr:hypothetical protein B0H10DRAFT_2443120 [Mycena sp. CBHHK59/15]